MVVHAPISASSCGSDTVFETMCGGMALPDGVGTCGPRADSLASAGVQRLSISVLTGGMKKDPLLQKFVLDEPATATYQASIPPSGAGLPGPFCCYSRCTPLVVAASAPAPRAPPGHHLADQCLPTPNSTRVPASDPSCPAAVELGGVLWPYRGPMSAPKPGQGSPWWYRTNGGRSCCYTTIAPDPPRVPPNDGHCPTCKCAAAGTPVATPTGEVAIESLAVGDLVLSMHRGRLQAVPLREVHRESVHDHVMVVARLANGRTVAMSPHHPTADGQEFGDLAAGSVLGDARVVAVERVAYPGRFTYDLLPASDTGTYVAAGALVGSTLARPASR